MSEEIMEEVSENEEKRPNKTLARIKVAVSSVVYIFLVFIVIFGISDGVYNGFPGLVPYIIMTVFLLMSFVRMYQSITGEIPEKKKKKKKKGEAEKEESADDEEV